MKRIFFYISLIFICGRLFADESVSGSITGNAVWGISKSPYNVLSDITIEPSGELIIEPGVTVKLAKNANIIVKGRLLAIGNKDSIISFSSSIPANHWGNLSFENYPLASQSKLQFCLLENAGVAQSAPIILDPRITPQIDSIKFVNAYYNGIQVKAGAYSNDLNLSIENIPYLIFSDITINKAFSLNIGSGAILKFAQNANLICKGRLNAIGAIDKQIYFTSIKDDSIGGDANRDGYSKGVAGDWGGIILSDASAYANLKFCNIKYGAGSNVCNNSMIYVDIGTLKAEYSSFSQSGNFGVRVSKTGNIDVGLGSEGSSGMNRFVGFLKPKYAIVNENSGNQSAKNNYWASNDSASIEQILYDKKDNSYKGAIEFIPFISSYPAKSPNIPTIIEPVNNQTNTEDALTIACAYQASAQFRYQVSLDSNFTNLIFDSISSDNSIQVLNLQNANTYYCRAKAVNLIGASAWSELRRFNTVDKFFEAPADIALPSNVKFQIADMNSDGELDLIYWGAGNKTQIFTRKNYIYTKYFEGVAIDSGITLINDFNNDGKLDFIIIGYSNNIWLSKYYQNNGAGFNEKDIDIPEISNLNGVSLDFDKNGRVDLFLQGDALGGDKTFIFENVEDAFILKDLNIPSVKSASIQAIDFNKDGACDIFVNSETPKLYINSNGALEEQSLSIPNLANIQSIFGDFESNGKIEGLIFGERFGISEAYLISKDNSGIISRKISDFPERIKSVCAGDFLNDGRLQIAISGDTAIKFYSFLNFAFTELYSLQAFRANSLVSADIDNSGKSSILYLDVYNSLKILYNKNFAKNLPPAKPSKLAAKIKGSDAYFSWSAPNDDKTSINSLKYNLTIINALDSGLLFQNSPFTSGKLSLNDANSLSQSSYAFVKDLPNGSYKWQVRAFDNSLNPSEISDNGFFIIGGNRLSPPQSWDFAIQTDYNALAIIPDTTNIIIKDRKISNGDALGAFFKRNDSLICGGYGIWEDGYPIVIPIWSDNSNTPIKDGFSSNELIRFKVWDAQIGFEKNVKVELYSGSERFVNDAILKIKNVSDLDKQKIYLDSNSFGFYALTKEPILNAPKEIFKDYKNSSFYIEDIDKEYYSIKSKSGNLKSLDNTRGFKLLSTDKDSVELEGYENDKNLAIGADSAETFFLPNYRSQNLNIISALWDNIKYLNYLSDDYGNIFYPKYNIFQFDTLISGKSYKTFANSNCQFPLSERKTVDTGKYERSKLFKFKLKPIMSGSSSIIVFQNNAMINGDEVAAFTEDGSLIGATNVKNKSAVFTIWGKNKYLDNALGAANGESLKLRYWSSTNNLIRMINLKSVIEANTGDDFGASLNYIENKVYLVNGAIGDIVSVKEESQSATIKLLDRNLYIQNSNGAKVEIYNLLGEKILEQNINNENNLINLDKFSSGFYFIALINGENKIYNKVVLQ